MHTAAVLPVKRFSQAKQRLGTSVADALRADLARAMVGDVLSALDRCAAIDCTIVVTNERAVAAAAHYLGATVVEDIHETGQSAAVALGIEQALAQDAERVLCVPGDCPALDPAEIDALLGGENGAGEVHDTGEMPDTGPALARTPDAPGTDSRTAATVTIIPDRHGTGTNGLLLAPPRAIDPSFGPDSCERHRELARVAGAACRIERLPSLLLDIDTGEDLAVLRERLAGERVRAPRTRSVLGLAAVDHPSRAA